MQPTVAKIWYEIYIGKLYAEGYEKMIIKYFIALRKYIKVLNKILTAKNGFKIVSLIKNCKLLQTAKGWKEFAMHFNFDLVLIDGANKSSSFQTFW